MKGFILGFLAASILGGGLVLAQQSTITDLYGHPIGTIQTPQPMVQQDWMAPSRQMGQQLQEFQRSGQRNPC